MNYAEDRLDRRARSTPNALSPSSDTGAKAEATATATTTQDQLACDLKRAQDVFARPPPAVEANVDTDADGGIISIQIQTMRELRAAHELAGKTLRDGGRSRQAVFHFGMAWKCCHWLEKFDGGDCGNNCCTSNGDGNGSSRSSSSSDEAENEWRSVGDYAQICELSGFPEIGVLALLFYGAGGSLDLDSIAPAAELVDGANGTTHDGSGHNDGDGGTQHGCGCGMTECGTSPCFVAFPSSSPIMNSILHALDALSINPIEGFPTASDILGHLAHITRKADTIGDPVTAMHSFLNDRKVMRGAPSILQYWDSDAVASPQHETIDSNDGQQCTSNNQQHQNEQVERRTLPPVILLLLLKLLYSSPVCGAFLQLACISLPYLAARFPPVSPEGRMLARHYKSHWAYYVFIRVLILGERVKKHRRGKGIHHVPVWDVVFGLETHQCEGPKKDDEEKKEEVGDKTTISRYLCGIFQACLSTSDKSITESKQQNIANNQHQSSPLPCITQQKISSHSTHQPIFVVGDSHVLSLAWQTLRINHSEAFSNDGLCSVHQRGAIYRTALPFPATGMKAWHVRPSTGFFTHYNLHACLQRLPASSSGHTIILSAGEIDCREGIGGTLLQGYYRNCTDAVERTVVEYLSALNDLAEQYQLQILVMPVAPHAYRSKKNGKAVGRARRRETMCLWNETLRRELDRGTAETSSSQQGNLQCKYDRVFLLDYEKKLQHADANSPVGYVLNPSYNADFTHVNSAIVPLVEDAILHSGCDLTLL